MSVLCVSEMHLPKKLLLFLKKSSEPSPKCCSTSCLSPYEDSQNLRKRVLNKSRCTICNKLMRSGLLFKLLSRLNNFNFRYYYMFCYLPNRCVWIPSVKLKGRNRHMLELSPNKRPLPIEWGVNICLREIECSHKESSGFMVDFVLISHTKWECRFRTWRKQPFL